MSLEHTKGIHLKSGDLISITEAECLKIQQDLINGAEWVFVQGELLHKGTIARVGNHQMTVDMRRYKQQDDLTMIDERKTPALKEPSIDEIYPVFTPAGPTAVPPRLLVGQSTAGVSSLADLLAKRPSTSPQVEQEAVGPHTT